MKETYEQINDEYIFFTKGSEYGEYIKNLIRSSYERLKNNTSLKKTASFLKHQEVVNYNPKKLVMPPYYDISFYTTFYQLESKIDNRGIVRYYVNGKKTTSPWNLIMRLELQRFNPNTVIDFRNGIEPNFISDGLNLHFMVNNTTLDKVSSATTLERRRIYHMMYAYGLLLDQRVYTMVRKYPKYEKFRLAVSTLERIVDFLTAIDYAEHNGSLRLGKAKEANAALLSLRTCLHVAQGRRYLSFARAQEACKLIDYTLTLLVGYFKLLKNNVDELKLKEIQEKNYEATQLMKSEFRKMMSEGLKLTPDLHKQIFGNEGSFYIDENGRKTGVVKADENGDYDTDII